MSRTRSTTLRWSVLALLTASTLTGGIVTSAHAASPDAGTEAAGLCEGLGATATSYADSRARGAFFGEDNADWSYFVCGDGGVASVRHYQGTYYGYANFYFPRGAAPPPPPDDDLYIESTPSLPSVSLGRSYL